MEKFTDEEKDTLRELIRCEYYQQESFLELMRDKADNIVESEVTFKRNKKISNKYGSNKRFEELEEIKIREQHQKALEEKYGFGIAYSILKLFERYEELNAVSPIKDIKRIEEIEKIIIHVLVLGETKALGFSFEQAERYKSLRKAFIIKYGLQSKFNELIQQRQEKILDEERENERNKLERKYGKGKSYEELLRIDHNGKRREELERKYGTGKSLDELERLEKDRVEKIRKDEQAFKEYLEHCEEKRRYLKDLIG